MNFDLQTWLLIGAALVLALLTHKAGKNDGKPKIPIPESLKKYLADKELMSIVAGAVGSVSTVMRKGTNEERRAEARRLAEKELDKLGRYLLGQDLNTLIEIALHSARNRGLPWDS